MDFPDFGERTLRKTSEVLKTSEVFAAAEL